MGGDCYIIFIFLGKGSLYHSQSSLTKPACFERRKKIREWQGTFYFAVIKDAICNVLINHQLQDFYRGNKPLSTERCRLSETFLESWSILTLGLIPCLPVESSRKKGGGSKQKPFHVITRQHRHCCAFASVAVLRLSRCTTASSQKSFMKKVCVCECVSVWSPAVEKKKCMNKQPGFKVGYILSWTSTCSVFTVWKKKKETEIWIVPLLRPFPLATGRYTLILEVINEKQPLYH